MEISDKSATKLKLSLKNKDLVNTKQCEDFGE
jgi:hypothetical protein